LVTSVACFAAVIEVEQLLGRKMWRFDSSGKKGVDLRSLADIYPNLTPKRPPSSVAPVNRVGTTCSSNTNPSGHSDGTASSFTVMMY